MKPLACGMALTLFLQLIQSNIDLLIISDQLCLSALIFCTVSAIGISQKIHIGTSLLVTKINLVTNIALSFACMSYICQSLFHTNWRQYFKQLIHIFYLKLTDNDMLQSRSILEPPSLLLGKNDHNLLHRVYSRRLVHSKYTASILVLDLVEVYCNSCNHPLLLAY